jgi:hypothetical protein
MDHLIEDQLNCVRFNPERKNFLEMYCYIQDKVRKDRTIHEIRFIYMCGMVCKFLYKPPVVQPKALQQPVKKKVERIKLKQIDLYKIATLG